jgi:hypothetical protein
MSMACFGRSCAVDGLAMQLDECLDSADCKQLVLFRHFELPRLLANV